MSLINFAREIRNFIFIFVLLLVSSQLVHGKVAKIFNLKDYDAVVGGQVDNSQALLKAWADACNWKGPTGYGSQLLISAGVYLVQPIKLAGPCNGPINFRNSGVLRAPPGSTHADHWINFQYIDGLTVDGHGVFDSQGQTVWHKTDPSQLPTAICFDFVTNSKVQHTKIINGKTTHFTIFGCENVTVNRIIISAPETSPNTDGVKIAYSKGIKLLDSNIGSGDDCVAMLTGSNNISIAGVTCGPGHGVSIGSMGSSSNFDQVTKVTVQNCTFTNTSNGVRIKTWATEHRGLVSGVTYQDIYMHNVDNPIIIDQNYCPEKDCPKGNSHVQINDVKYVNIKGTSRAQYAVNLQCSATNPCNVELKDIDLTDSDPKVQSVASCSNVKGTAEEDTVQFQLACLRLYEKAVESRKL
ncbi:Polygalacturonase-like protein [Drosera capensis]